VYVAAVGGAANAIEMVGEMVGEVIGKAIEKGDEKKGAGTAMPASKDTKDATQGG
jgi:hypothetical protein